jgi:hypothetical protein
LGTYTLGTWTTSAKQDKGLARLFNRLNAELAASAIANGTAINAGGSGYSVGNVLTLVDSGTMITPMTLTVTAVNGSGAVTGVAMVSGLNAGGNYTTHQAAANHQTTVSPAGGTGCVIRVNFYQDIPDMATRNGGILDVAAFGYRRDWEQEVQSQISAQLATATDGQLANAAAAVGATVPV